MKRAILFALVIVLGSFGAGVDTASGAELSPVACSPERPLIQKGEAVRLRVWAFTARGEPLTYEWVVNAGTVSGTGSEVNWELGSVTPDSYEATAYVSHPSGETGKCTIRILVEPEGRSPATITGWSFLLKGDKETDGYGLYSYILFGSRPAEATRERFLKALEAYITLQESVASLEASGIKRRSLNVTYVPVTKKFNEKGRPTAVWLLENYDFARARAILSLLPGPYRTEGPYIVSRLERLGTSDPVQGNYLYQDLSIKEPKVIAGYAREFLNQAAQERFWEKRTAKNIALNLQNTLFLMARASIDAKDAAKELKEIRDAVKWVE
jgi:hypothetical protein